MVPAGWCAAGGAELPHTLQEWLVARSQVAVLSQLLLWRGVNSLLLYFKQE